MFHKRFSRKEKNTLQTSQKRRDQQQIEQILISHLAKSNSMTPEQLQQHFPELEAFLQGMNFAQQIMQQNIDAKLSELHLKIEKIHQQQAESQKIMQKFFQEEETRDRILYKRVKVIHKAVTFIKRQVQAIEQKIQQTQKYTQPTLYAMLVGTAWGDVFVSETVKEVVKAFLGEEIFEELASGITWVLQTLGPLYRLYAEGISFLFPNLTIKAATICIIAAATLLNLMVSIRSRLRKKGLGKK
jgi:hypothetical protein